MPPLAGPAEAVRGTAPVRPAGRSGRRLGPLDAVRRCLGRYATLRGRAGRAEFWWFALVVAAGILLPGLLARLWLVAAALPLLAAGWRRMHDTGRPGKLLLPPILVSCATALLVARLAPAPQVTVLGSAMLIVISIVQLAVTILLTWWLTRPSDPGANRYGAPPPA